MRPTSPASAGAPPSRGVPAAALALLSVLLVVPWIGPPEAAAFPRGVTPWAAGEPPPAPPPEETAEPRPSEGEPRAGDESPSGGSPDGSPAAPPIPKRLEPYVPLDERDVEVVITTDEPCAVTIDGEPRGTVEPEEPLELTIRSTARTVRATSLDLPRAVWSERLAIAPDTERLEVRVKMTRAIREIRRQELGTGVVRDRDAALMWMARDNGRDVRWEKAAEYCGELGLAGFDDWRLPTLAELRAREAIWSRSEYKILDGIALTGCCPWSSEAAGEERAWNFNFRFRKPFAGHRDYSLGLRALCVRELTLDEASGEGDGGDDGEGRKRGRRKRRRGADEAGTEAPPAPEGTDDPPPGRSPTAVLR